MQNRKLKFLNTRVTNKVTRILGQSCTSLQILDLSFNDLTDGKVVLHLLPDKLPSLQVLKLRAGIDGKELVRFIEARPGVIVEPLRETHLASFIAGNKVARSDLMQPIVDNAQWRDQVLACPTAAILYSNGRIMEWVREHGANLKELDISCNASDLDGASNARAHGIVMMLTNLQSLRFATDMVPSPFARSGVWPNLRALDLQLRLTSAPSISTLFSDLCCLGQLRHLSIDLESGLVPPLGWEKSTERHSILEDLCSSMSSLRTLKLTTRLTGPPGWCLGSFIIQHPHLRMLQLFQYQSTAVVESLDCPNLRELHTSARDWSEQALQGLAQARLLRIIKLYDVENDQLISTLTNKLLQHVRLGNSKLGDDLVFATTLCSLDLVDVSISDKQLTKVCSTCTRLDTLHLSNLKEACDVEQCVQSTSMRAITLQWLQNRVAGQLTLSGAPNLATISLENCGSVEQIRFRDFKHLVHVRLQGMIGDKLSEVLLRGLPNLQQLDVSGFGSLRELRVESVSLRSCHLGLVRGQQTIELQCPNLRQLRMGRLAGDCNYKQVLDEVLAGSPLLDQLILYEVDGLRKEECDQLFTAASNMTKLEFTPKDQDQPRSVFKRKSGEVSSRPQPRRDYF